MRYVSGSQDSGGKAKAARLGRPTALPAAFLHPSMSARSSSALAEVPTRAKSFWQALMTQLVVALGSSLESQKSTTTLRPASPPLALTSVAQALTAFTDFWNSPGTSGLFTSAIRPTLMVVAVSPTSVPGTVPAGEADGVADADDEAAADEVAGADDEAGCCYCAAGGTAPRRQQDRGRRRRDQPGETRASPCPSSGAAAARPFAVRSHSCALHDFIACEALTRRRPRVHAK